jgi:hypothetical protein
MTSGTGTCSVTAIRAGDGNYNVSLLSTPATVGAVPAAQAALLLTGVPTTAQAFNTSFTVGSAGGTGTGSVTYAATGACTVDPTSGSVHMTSGTGTCSITATKAADANYNSTTTSVGTVSAARADQIITWAAPAAITYGSTLSGVLDAVLALGDGALTYDRQSTDVLAAGTYNLTVTAAATNNYNLATKSVSLIVNRVALTATIVASGKTYDGTTAATISSCSVATKIGTDDVGCTTSGATFASANAGTQTVTATVLLSGTTKDNYSLTSTAASGSATILAKALTGNITVSDKPYDGNTSATILTRTLGAGVVGTDAVSL